VKNSTRPPLASSFVRYLRAAAIAAAIGSQPALAGENDICENKSGPELIRCIEAAARSGNQGKAADAPKAQPPASRPAAPATSRPVQVPAAPVVEAPRAPAEDCTGRSGDALRRCLAAGGRLSPDAAIVTNTAPATPTVVITPAREETCEGKSGELLRLCVEAQSKSAPAARKSSQEIVACTGYTPADQPLCVHRNTALVECRNKKLYPDFGVCLRSHMIRAPEPGRADCSKLQARARSHCEARNHVYASCNSDKMGYFACLEQRLGADAVLTRR
jgi:hypothetical protein